MEENIKILVDHQIYLLSQMVGGIPPEYTPAMRNSTVSCYKNRSRGFVDCLWVTNHITQDEWDTLQERIMEVDR